MGVAESTPFSVRKAAVSEAAVQPGARNLQITSVISATSSVKGNSVQLLESAPDVTQSDGGGVDTNDQFGSNNSHDASSPDPYELNR